MLHYYCKLCRNLRCSLPGVWHRLVEAQVDEVRVHTGVGLMPGYYPVLLRLQSVDEEAFKRRIKGADIIKHA